MATIGSAVFLSSDEEDADYVDSGPSSDDDERDEAPDFSKARTQQEKLNASIRAKKISRLYREMREEAESAVRHTPTVSKNDFMLQFQTPCPKTEKTRHTKESFLRYVKIARGECLADSSERFDISTFKKKCRDADAISCPDHGMTLKAAQDASNIGAEIVVNQVVRYAGENITIQKKLHKDSKEYRQHLLQEQRKALQRGNESNGISSIDSLAQEFGKAKTITSVEKSLSDWQNFVGVEGLEDQLRKNRKDGFLGRQAFLASAEQRRDEQRLNAKRKRMAMGAAPSSGAN